MKKLITLLVAVVMSVACCFGLVGCGEESSARTIDLSVNSSVSNAEIAYYAEYVPADFKIGFIFLHDEKSTYDLNFYQSAQEAVKAMGLKANQVVYKFNVAEDQACYDAAKEMIQDGAKAIFADSFGHGTFMAQAAKEFKDVQFYHATGTGTSVDEAPANLHNAFASIYVGRYLGGVAAGLKLVELYGDTNGKVSDANAKVGYVGAFPYAEVKSGYTSFYLGVKSVCENATMNVKFTNSWYDEVAEKSAAEALIAGGCKLISQHADSMGAPTACEKAGIPNVSYNGSTVDKCPNTFIISSKIDWAPYMKMIIASFANAGNDTVLAQSIEYVKQAIGKDFTGDMFTFGSVKMSAINADAMAKGTVAKLVEEMRNLSSNPSAYVFDCSKFTVNGVNLTTYKADVVDDGTFTPETEVIKTAFGVTYFAESEFRSAPYFDIDIDGITIIE